MKRSVIFSIREWKRSKAEVAENTAERYQTLWDGHAVGRSGSSVLDMKLSWAPSCVCVCVCVCVNISVVGPG